MLPILLLAFAGPVLADLKEYWWNLTYANANPDALFERRAIGVNGSWPPPPIEVSSNDLLVVHVTNSLDQPSSLHHHGMFFNGTSWMDGAMGVTECGIPPGDKFDYVVPINSSGQWGTYWVHAHAFGQYVDGLRAPLLLHAQKEVHRYDDEFTVILSDWYHNQHSSLLKKFISISNPGGAEPVPNSALIYFSKNSSYLPPISSTSHGSVTSQVGFNGNTSLPFIPGKTYRLRIINTSAFSMFYFWIDGHDMRIIEVDGTDIEEYPIDLLSITTAQRYSVLVTARNDTSSNWAIHANFDTDMFDKIPPGLVSNITSSITYDASVPINDLGPIQTYKDINDTALVPSKVVSQPRATRSIDLEVSFDTMDDGTNRAMFNTITYKYPLVPALFSALSLENNASVQTAYGPSSFVIEGGDVVDLVIKNGDAGKHPFHLHGHKFQIVGRATNYSSLDPADNPPVIEGQSNPMRRDTVHVPSGGSATLRFVADNPGTWMLHCHIEWHLEAGLVVQFIEAPLELQKNQGSVPPIMFDHCKKIGTPDKGNAAGKFSTTDLSGLNLGPFPQKLGWRPKGIGALVGCILSALLGMAMVVWYSLLGRQLTDQEVEHEVRKNIHAKEQRREKIFNLFTRS